MSESPQQPPVQYWRLSSFYFFYFAFLGALLPFWGLYMAGEGYSPEQIGGLFAVLLVTRMVVPNFWGWLADATGKRMALVRWGSFLAFVVFLGVLPADTYGLYLLVFVAFSCFWNAVLPQFEVITLQQLGARRERYSLIRLWGSVGFIVAVIGLGAWFDRHAISVLPYLMLALILGIWGCSLWVASPDRTHRKTEGPGFIRLLRQPSVLAFFAVCFLLQLSHGPFYSFFSIYLEGYGYSRSMIGLLWAVGVLAEVVLFVYMHRLIRAYGVRYLMLFSLAFTALRWCIVAGLPLNLPALFFAQSLHALSFGAMHACAMHWVHKVFGGGHEGQGQALYSSISFGAGGSLGALYSGYATEYLGAQAPFWAAALASAIAWWVAWRWLRND